MPGTPIGDPVRLADGTALPLSKGMRAGDFVFLSGQVGIGPDGTIADSVEDQTRQCIENGRAVLEAAGLTLGDVVKTTIWLTDASYFAAFNAVYGSYFPEGPPARSTVASALMIPGLKVEIEFIAHGG